MRNITKKQYKTGLIGYGYWGPILLRAFHNSGRFKVLKVCDHNKAKLSKVSNISQEIEICYDHNDIIKDDRIDVVIIATQARTHYNLVSEALIHNKNVFVEKPFVLNPDEAVSLMRLNREKNLMVMVDHTYLFAQHYKKVKEIVESRRLGKILHFHSTRSDFGLFQKDTNIVWHLLYHDAYLLLDLFKGNKIKSIKASGFSHIIDNIEDTAYASICYENGLSAEILVNMLFPIKERKIIVTGDKKILHWDDTIEDKLKIYSKNAFFNPKSQTIKYNDDIKFEILKVPQIEALKTEIDYFFHCLNENKTPVNNEESAYYVVALLNSVESAMTKKGVSLVT